MLGTPDFIAPEQIDDAQGADIRADIYSLGCTLYCLLSGHPPFQAATLYDMLQAHHSMDARMLNFVRPEVPAELAAIAAKMMAKEPHRRFQTPGEVAKALAPFFKKPSATSARPNHEANSVDAQGAVLAAYDVTQPGLEDGVAAAVAPAAEKEPEMWSSLVEFKGTDDEVEGIATDGLAPRLQSRWLWPTVAAGVLICGLLGVWAAGVYTSATMKKGELKPAGADASIGSVDKKLVRVPKDPPRGANLPKSSLADVGPATKAEAMTPSSKTENLGPVLDEVASVTSPRVADSSSISNTATPTPSTTIPGQEFHEIASIKTPDPVIQARLLPDSRHVLYETDGKNRALWSGDLTDPRKPRARQLEAKAPSGWTRLVLAGDGRFAVLAGKDKTLRRWDLQSGESARLRTGKQDVAAIALTPDNQRIAYVRDGAIELCDAFPGSRSRKKELPEKFGDRTDLIAFSPEGDRIVSTHADRVIRVWDGQTGREIGRTVSLKPMTGLAVFPGGRRVLTSFSDPNPTIGIWDLETSQQLRRIPSFGTSITLSADGGRALIGGGNLMLLRDLKTGEELIREELRGAVLHVAFSKDDRQTVSSTDQSVRVWALPAGRRSGEQPPVIEVAQFLGHEGILNTVVVSPDGRRVLASGWPNTIRLWDRETGQLIRSFDERGREIRSVAFSPKGDRVLSGGDDGVVRLWDLKSGDPIHEFKGHVDNVMSVAFSPDGKLAYSAGGAVIRNGQLRDQEGTDFAIRIWDVKTGLELRRLDGHKGMVWSVAVSSDGYYVLSGGNDAAPILWDAKTGHEIHRFRGHTNKVECVAFLPNSRRMISSGVDGTIRLWDVESGRELFPHFTGPTGQNFFLAVSPDGHRLFSSDGGRELRYWNVDTGKLIQKLSWEAGPTGGSFTPDGRNVVWAGWGSLLRMYSLADAGPADRSTSAPVPWPR